MKISSPFSTGKLKELTGAIVTEFCTSDLESWMVEKRVSGDFAKGLSSKEVMDDFVPFFLNAVQQMRAQQIVHLDLKPANILHCGGVWKVADFNLAEIVVY